jgi:penicillin amidase
VKHFIRLLKYAGLGVGALLALLIAVALGIALYLRGSLPQTEGTVFVQGLTSPVTITRDAHGIPHIQAASLNDALYGLGFVHGQDRLWQMDLTRRIVQGRVAEIAGPPGLTPDTYMRTLGLYRAAQSAAARLTPNADAAVKAYAAGVNAAMRAHTGPLPPEFTIAQVTPSSWTPSDSVAVIKSLALQLSANAFREALRVRLLAELTPAQLDQLQPPFSTQAADALKEAMTAGDVLPTLEKFAQLEETLDLQGASNNWVVDGAHSASGKPILANDPHLGLTVPAIWYLAKLSWPGGETVGGTVPGIPGMVTGRTRNLAWGLTTTGGDTQDLFVEKLNPANADEYLSPEGYKTFRTRSELIEVRFGSDQTITVRETDNGPVLPTGDPRLKPYVPQGRAISLRWGALGPEDRTIETTLAILAVPDASEASIKTMFENYKAPLQSYVYAGGDGSIGMIVPGPIPLRNPEFRADGIVPGAGWLASSRWSAQTEYKDWPHFRNDPRGWFATANNKIVPDGFPHKVASEWDSEYRAKRIGHLLTAREKHDRESFKAMQRDDVDQYAVEVLPELTPLAQPQSAPAKEALALLKSWNGEMAAARPEPLIFAAWMRELTRALMADELGEAFNSIWGYWPEFIQRVLKNENDAARWCDDETTKNATEDCPLMVTRALQKAVDDLRGEYGNSPAKWRWSDAHVARLSHLGFGQIPVLNRLFNFEVPVPGGSNTIDRADHRMNSSTPFAAVHGSGFRGISDLGDPDRSLYMIATGQSGNVYSPHYRDLTPLWARREYLEIGATPKPGDPGVRVLSLTPIARR